MAKPSKKAKKTETVCLRFTVELLKAIDAAAAKNAIDRTSFITIGVTKLLEKGL